MPIITESTPTDFQEAPPERVRAGGRREGVASRAWKAVADDLRAHPNMWRAIGHDMPANTSQKINTGQLVAFRDDECGVFEAVARDVQPNKRATIWAVYWDQAGDTENPDA